MIKIENPTYMTCKEMHKKYPNCMIYVGKYKDLNETNGNDGGYPFALIEDSDLGKGVLDDDKYPEWKPMFLLDTQPAPEILFWEFGFGDDELELIENVSN